MPIRFNQLLLEAGFEPRRCTIMLHTPRERELRAKLGDIFMRNPLAFEGYQHFHSAPGSLTLSGRPHVASFVGMADGTCVFAALYDVDNCGRLSAEELAQEPTVMRLLADYGMDYRKHTDRDFFRLDRRQEMSEFSGRLVINPTRTRAYIRLAETLDPQVVALSREDLFDTPVGDWREASFNGAELRVLGPSAAARLREWRGIYLIVDESDGARYVGSAYGETNMLGRWQTHVARDTGVTAELSRRDPVNFRFSILERVSPDMPPEDVIRLERTWMDRLHTIRYGLNS
jgi:hypothetical protein